MTKCLLATLALLIATPAFAQGNVSLFKVFSVKDEVVIGLSAEELSALGGNDAGQSRRRCMRRAR